MILVKSMKMVKELPVDLAIHCVFPRSHPGIKILQHNVKPDSLIPLEDTPWPNEVKRKIVDIMKGIGIPDPMSQKLVEPYAIAFGGDDPGGAYDLSKVDWEMVVDYFIWEAASWTHNSKEIDRLFEESIVKRGFSFCHRGVYSPRDMWA
jgi:hypothetical protein